MVKQRESHKEKVCVEFLLVCVRAVLHPPYPLTTGKSLSVQKRYRSKEQTSDPGVRQKVHDLLFKVCKSFKFGICCSNMAGAVYM